MRLALTFCVLLPLSAISFAQDTNFPVGPQYLITTADTLLLRPIETPSLSLESGLPPAVFASDATLASDSVLNSGPSNGAQSSATGNALTTSDLATIFWGEPSVREIVVTDEPGPSNLPASIANFGVTGMTDAQTLREQGYGVSMADSAAFWKTHKRHAPHVYTNEDLERLHRD